MLGQLTKNCKTDYWLNALVAAGTDVANVASNSATAYAKEADLGAVVNSKLTLTVASAGNAKSGTAIIFLK